MFQILSSCVRSTSVTSFISFSVNTPWNTPTVLVSSTLELPGSARYVIDRIKWAPIRGFGAKSPKRLVTKQPKYVPTFFQILEMAEKSRFWLSSGIGNGRV